VTSSKTRRTAGDAEETGSGTIGRVSAIAGHRPPPMFRLKTIPLWVFNPVTIAWAFP
jgi:hypothetical protein